MGRTKQDKKIVIICSIICITFSIFLFGGIIFTFWSNDGDLKWKIIFTIIAVVALIVCIAVVILLAAVGFQTYSKGSLYKRDRDYRNDFNLLLYSCKNGRYIHKILYSSRNDRIDYRDYDDKVLHDYPTNIFNEIYNEVDVNERIDDILHIIDSRVIDKVLFFEARTISGYAYAYIDTELRTYSVILFNSEEITRRDEVNNAKKRIVLENDRIIEEMDKIFDDIISDCGKYKAKYEDGLEVRDIVLKIKEIIDDYE